MTVGQDLVKLEPGSPSEGGKTEDASSEPKQPASSDQPTSSDPAASKKDTLQQDSSASAPPAEEKKPAPSATEQAKESLQPKQAETKKSEPKPSSSVPTLGNREERRVCIYVLFDATAANIPLGQNEQDALTDC